MRSNLQLFSCAPWLPVVKLQLRIFSIKLLAIVCGSNHLHNPSLFISLTMNTTPTKLLAQLQGVATCPKAEKFAGVASSAVSCTALRCSVDAHAQRSLCLAAGRHLLLLKVAGRLLLAVPGSKAVVSACAGYAHNRMTLSATRVPDTPLS